MTRRYYLPLLILVLAFVAIYFLFFHPSTTLPPQKLPVSPLTPFSQNQPLPKISAKHVFVLDTDSQTVLYQLAPDDQIYPASTTKMMTALVALGEFPLTKSITVTKSYPQGQNLGFTPGESVTVEQLLYALLIQSANDSAEILAENYPGGRPAFIAAMNAEAFSLRLTHTHFVNPTGLDENDHYSSAADLTRLAEVFIKHPYLAKIVASENAVIASSISPHVLTNVNELVGRVPGVLGIKTGFTDGAGQSLVTLVNRQNHPVIISLLGSTDRFSDTQKLIDWVYQNFIWQ